MEGVGYRVQDNRLDNRLGLSIKYPEGIRSKWSEADVEVECGECGSTTLDTDKTGELLVIACLDCPNHWEGAVDTVLNWYDTEEAYATVRSLDTFEEVK